MTYYGANRKTYTLDDIPIKKGGEGAIHRVSGKSNLLAKIYLAPAKSPELKEKISLMVKKPPRQDVLDQIAWPIDILSDAGGNFVGFIMPKLSIDVELGDVYKYPAKKKVTLTGEQKVIIAINICRVISAIHDLDYVFGDFNPCNIGVNLSNGHVAFLDTDSYHITDKSRGKTYRCNVCLNGYVAPELIKKCKGLGYAKAPLPTFTKETDLFSLAIHIFKLLMNGFTPYNGIPEGQRSSAASPGVGNAAIEMDNYCFKAGNKPLSVAVLPIQSFPNDVQRLFARAFDEGHRNPSKRPTAKEWDAVLTSYHSNLKQCNANPMHHHYKGLQTCPYCEADQRYNFAMSMNSVYGTPSGSPSSGQMTFSTPMTPPPTPPSSSSYTSSTSNVSRSGQYTGSVLSSGVYSGGVSQRSSNGFSKKLLKISIIALLAIVIVVSGYFGITSAINNNKIEKVEAMIAALPADENYYLDYQAEIVDAYAAYMELDEKLQGKVENADTLISVMDGLKVAEAFEQRQNMQFTKLDGGGYSVKLKEGANSKISGELTIPSVYRQEPVVTIEDYAFENCRSITAVVVPESITTIGVGAFKRCSNLQEIVLPFIGRSESAKAYEAVLGYIFGYEDGYTNDKYYGYSDAHQHDWIVDWNTDNRSRNSSDAFINRKIGTVPGAVWQYTAHNHLGTTYYYPQSYYYYIPATLKKVTVTKQTAVPVAAFNGCMNIVEINYENELTEIGVAAFQNCESLEKLNADNNSNINVFGSYTDISDYAFKGCNKITQISISGGVYKIGKYAFENLGITSIVLPNTVEIIDVGAFKGCNNLQEITLPFVGRSESAEVYEAVLGYIFGYEDGDTNGGRYGYGDPALYVVDWNTDNRRNNSSNEFINRKIGSIPGIVWQYTAHNHLGTSYYYPQSYHYYIPATLKKVTITKQQDVPIAAFNNCEMLQEILYLNGIALQGEYAFQNCTATIVKGN